MNSMIEAGIFLVNTLFTLYLTILGVRLILAWERANYFNPIIRFVITLTQPLIAPVRRILPNIGKLETATLFWLIILEIVKYILILAIMGQQQIDFMVLPLSALLAVIILLIQIFFYSILIFAVLSWIHSPATPIMQVLAQLSAPVLRPLQKIIPMVSGFDITPLVALILLQVLLILL